ncbi:oligosaccharide repeat unit polymerase [Flavobacterium sp. AC]|uniref:Oligosaccharide repeat unit polymerase n=1 Tax=Flavobacterium azizsancarii TaxID=2961580 RepID=A0ABT4W8D8_9FLAO|nr:O-antigen polymerase [Flavobacterium azizsancarii]MDA6068803.1 oligosaccharide repeat unit polymerase [Flavobacterium azizsancarii]
MKINVTTVKIGFFLGFLGLFLASHFEDIDIPSDQIISFLGYYCLATTMLLFSLNKYQEPINPISVYSVFIFLLSYSFIRLADAQIGYSFNTLLVINISIFSYFLGTCFKVDYKPIKLFKINNKLRRTFIYGICILAFFTFILECMRFGYIPVLQIGSVDIYNETNDKLIPFLHYFIILLGFVPAWSYILFKQEIVSKKEFHFFCFLTLIVLINYLSRQLYLMTGFSFFVAYSFYNVVNFKRIIISAVSVIVIFFSIGYLRFKSDSPVSYSEFSRAYAGIDNKEVNFFESIIVEYASKRFSALNEAVNYGDRINYLGKGMYTFRPLTSLLLLEKTGVIKRDDNLDTENLVATYAIDPYLDFWFFGVVFLNVFYGFILSRYFAQFRNNYNEAIVKFSIVFFCIIMAMFVNYFNTMLVWLGLVFNKILIGGIITNKLESE